MRMNQSALPLSSHTNIMQYAPFWEFCSQNFPQVQLSQRFRCVVPWKICVKRPSLGLNDELPVQESIRSQQPFDYKSDALPIMLSLTM